MKKAVTFFSFILAVSFMGTLTGCRLPTKKSFESKDNQKNPNTSNPTEPTPVCVEHNVQVLYDEEKLKSLFGTSDIDLVLASVDAYAGDPDTKKITKLTGSSTLKAHIALIEDFSLKYVLIYISKASGAVLIMQSIESLGGKEIDNCGESLFTVTLPQ